MKGCSEILTVKQNATNERGKKHGYKFEGI